MKRMNLVCAIGLAVAAAGVVGASQDKPAAKIPERGSTVVAEGCLTPSALQATMTSLVGDESGDGVAQSITYQLKGDGALLKRMHKEQDGRSVRVTGVLKSRLPGSESRGRRLGGTTFVVGTSPSAAGANGTPTPMETLPILEVKSFEDAGTKCS